MTLPQPVQAPFDSSGRPVYLQLADRLTTAIAAGDLAPGALLDSETRMAGQLALSIPTVNRAVACLIDRGRVVRQRGVGTRILPPGSVAADLDFYRPSNSYISQCNLDTDILEDRAS